MKKSILLFAVLFLALSTAPAHAIPLLFDIDGPGTAYDRVLMDELSGEFNALAFVTQFLGADGIFNNGDRFTESFQLDINELNYVGSTVLIIPSSGVSYGIIAELNNVGGAISNHTDGGTPTTWDDINIADDTYTGSFDTGTAELFWDPTPSTPLSGDEETIATFDVAYGTLDTYLSGTTFTSDIEINLKSTSIAAEYFYTLGGVDYSTFPDGFLLAVADNSVNLTGFAGFAGAPGEEDYLIFAADDNGTDVEFSAVPEPSTMLLLGLGLLGISTVGRKKIFKK